MLDVDALSEMMAGVVADEVQKAIAPLHARIAELETRDPVAGPAGEKGDKGEPGQDGAASEVDVVVEALRPATEELISTAVAKAVAEIPPPEKGEPGEKGEAGERGENGADGNDGRGVRDLLINREGQLVATMDDGEMKGLGVIVGKDGRDGADGKDGEQGEPGFSLDDFDIERGSDGRTFTLKFERGDTRHSYEMTFPSPVYCGVWKEVDEYAPGDMVTWGGSTWHCNRAEPGKPDTKDSGWQLMVKKGRDGKDARG